MNQKELIFDWSERDSRFKELSLAAFFVSLGLFIATQFLELRLPNTRNQSNREASILRFTESDMVHEWAMKAHEEGPFPASFFYPESGLDSVLSLLPEKNPQALYQPSLRTLPSAQEIRPALLSSHRSSVFPKVPEELPQENSSAPIHEKSIAALVTPLDPSAKLALPSVLPVFPGGNFQVDSQGPFRFVLLLSPQGFATQVIPLDGYEADLPAVLIPWLRQIAFQPKPRERWITLQVDFNPQSAHDSIPD